jgi:sugar (pentulose or hexulose) kinase
MTRVEGTEAGVTTVDAAVALGIDIGTSGVRAIAVDEAGQIAGAAARRLPAPARDGARAEQRPEAWREATRDVLRDLANRVPLADLHSLAVDGTSGTVLAISAAGEPLGSALMYNDARADAQAARITSVAPPTSGAQGATSALAKLLHLCKQGLPADTWRIVHQADWLAGWLCGRHGLSDENNALKMGYDPIGRAWPPWFDSLPVDRRLLPEVRGPGTPIGPLDAAVAADLGLPKDAVVRAGTTDGVASFLATGAARPGEGVTALGSTLVIKLVAERPVFDVASGVYSHRLGDLWLPGGASNVGGQVLAKFFSTDDLARLRVRIDPERPSGLDYYPLPAPGERFPIADPTLRPVLEPRPADDALFLQGLFEGTAKVERLAYDRLSALGAPAVTAVRSVGGGASDPVLTRIRARALGVPMPAALGTEAAYGTALLALRGVPKCP